MDRIQRISAYLLWVCNVLLIALPLLIILEWLFIDSMFIRNLLIDGLLQSTVRGPEGDINLGTIEWTHLTKVLGFSGHMLAIAPIVLGLLFLKFIFQNYKNGDIFNPANARQYRCLGLLFFLDALIVQPLSDFLMVLAVTILNPVGYNYLTLWVGAVNLRLLFCGVIMLVVSWVMLEASKLQDEHKFII